MNVKAENEKIAQAMKGQRKAKGQAAVAAGILGILDGSKTAEEVLQDPAIVAVIGTPEEVEVAAVGVEVIREEITPKRKPTPKERATGPRVIPGTGIVVDESDKVVGVDEEIVQKIEEKNMTVKETPAKAVKETTVLEDPIENQALIRMRAKWAAQRADVVVARFEKKEEEGTITPAERKEMKVAKANSVKAWKIQERELQTLRSMRERAKGIKVEELPEDLGEGGGLQVVHPGTPESEASSPAETAV
jgi:hypothetical protein